MKPSHISYYLLDYSHDTPLKFLLENKKINLPEEDQISELLDLIYDQLDNFGYNRYEISSWSLPRKECIHNKYYWKNYEYIGFGVSAGSHIGNLRTVNTSELPTYLEKIKTGLQPQEFTNKNDDFQELIETLFMGLRLSEGLKYDYLKQRFSDELLNKVLTPLKDNLSDYLSLNGSIKLTKKGMDFSRFVFENLLDIAQTNS
jgi:oxygen-independent coproporphyrinogen-3 oxidase